jgi:hypothetical protein
MKKESRRIFMGLLKKYISVNYLLILPAVAVFILVILFPLAATAAEGTDEQADLAKKLANPIANLVSLPLQSNWDFNNGPENATRYTMNVQPVIPFSISKEWSLITRTILPIIYAQSPVKGGESSEGIGDIVQSFFFSPKEPTSGGWIWGVGPVICYPSGSEELSTSKWGIGPTAVALKQESGWTYGMLANHIASFAGSGPNYISATFVQPFLAYTTKTYTTFTVNTESTYNWREEQWIVPINLMVSQLVKIGGVPMSFQAGGRVYADRPDGGPDWGIRFAVTFLFPK